MNQHVGDINEVINRNVVVSLLLKQGYNVFLPVYDDGIDFIIHRRSDDRIAKVQLKSRWTIDRGYIGRDISIAFPYRNEWYLVPHETMVERAPEAALASPSWKENGVFTNPARTEAAMERLAEFRLQSIEAVAEEAVLTEEAQAGRTPDQERRRKVFDELRELRKRLPPQPPLTVEEILEMRDEGRRY